MNPKGLIVQFGGQTPLNLAKALESAGAPIIGTSVESIDIAEDRERFQALVERLGLKQPPNGITNDLQEAIHVARRVGYPILVRPSYVLGGRGMEIVYDEPSLIRYVTNAMEVSPGKPILLDKFLESAIEADVDCISDGVDSTVGGVMQHIEEAGIHSGDSASVLPPHSLPSHVVDEIKRQTKALAKELNVRGLMNIQFAITGLKIDHSVDSDKQSKLVPNTSNQGEVPVEIFVLEVNPRASRTIPFVSKAIGIPMAKLASLVMVGKTLKELNFSNEITPSHYSVKESVFPFNKFPGVDIILGPEMRSTGEVMGIDDSFPMAFAKSQLAASSALPLKGKVFLSVSDRDKSDISFMAKKLHKLGYQLIATRGTAQEIKKAGLPVEEVSKLQEGRPNLIDLMKNGQIALILNTPVGRGSRTDEGKIRSAAVSHGVTCITTMAAAQAAVDACAALREKDFSVTAIQDRY